MLLSDYQTRVPQYRGISFHLIPVSLNITAPALGLIYIYICQVRVVSYFDFFPLNPRRVTSTCALYESRRHPRFWALFNTSGQGRGIFGSTVTRSPKNS